MRFERTSPGVLEMIFDAPNLNAVDVHAHAMLPKVWSVIDDDSETKAVIVREEGRAFSVGGAFSMVEDQIRNYEGPVRVLREARDIFYNLLACQKPIISAIHGLAVGAGLVIGMMADISIAARTAKIVDGHPRLGVAAGDHAAAVWPMLCGIAIAKYYLMTCKHLTGEEAERIGLVSLAGQDDKPLDVARETARDLCVGAQEAIQWTKRWLNLWYTQNAGIFEASLGYKFLGFGGPPVIEGVALFRERRKPQFR
jgi:enoyl-CoA hydratase